jgi:hypothetical protein
MGMMSQPFCSISQPSTGAAASTPRARRLRGASGREQPVHDSGGRAGVGSRARTVGRWLPLSWLVVSAACGVHEYPQGTAQAPNQDHSSDFGPSTAENPATGAAGAAVSTGGAGTSGVNTGAPAAGKNAPPGMTTPGMPNMPTNPTPTNPQPTAAGAGAVASQPGAAGAAGTAPPTAAPPMALDLGGTPVAKEDVIAFIHIGHSNMAGRATGPTADRPYFFTDTDPHAWMYHTGSAPALAKEPYTAGDNLMGTYGGPGTALLKQAVQMAPTKYFMSLGFGKESAYCSQFLPGALYYDTLIAAAKAIKDRVTFGAIVIMLGITERHGTSADVTGYSTCINTLVTDIRNDVGRPDLPLLITDYEQEATGDLAITGAFAQSIIPEIHKIPMVVSNSVLVPTDGLGMQDDHHFNFDGHKVWTQRVLDLMKSNGWFPWAQ